ncbi:MAG: DEAD/DEAH box helicase [Clostridia bacterium]|nr:DEAD/DEAH box helicase [Clostridia bacterium]
MNSFNELNICKELTDAIEKLGFSEMTQIQKQAIPEILQGHDIIGQSQTGTGKTATFMIPAIEKVDTENRKTQVLILCPTRELANQNVSVAKKLGRFKKALNITAVYGGDSIERQIKDLKKGCQLVVGTPGRIMDHLNRKTLKLNDIKVVILDEADEMLNMGFEEDINKILSNIDYEHQTLLFSATMPKRILAITKKYQTNPKMIKVTKDELTVKSIEQIYFDTKEKMKPEILKRVLKVDKPKSAVIFCNTKKKVDDLMDILRDIEISAEALHGDIKQSSREKTMKNFKAGKINVLVATDVAARGIDIDNLDMVFNYDLPQEDEYYVHRIGRTGRNGKSGKAITLVVGKEMRKLKEIENYAKTKITKGTPPTLDAMNEIISDEMTTKIHEVVDSKEFAKADFITNLHNEGYSYETIAKALYTIMSGKNNTNKVEFTADKNGMVKLFANVGKKDKIAVKDIIGSIAANTSLSGKDIGKVILLDSYSFIEVPKDYVLEVLEIMNKEQIKGKNVKIEVSDKM